MYQGEQPFSSILGLRTSGSYKIRTNFRSVKHKNGWFFLLSALPDAHFPSHAPRGTRGFLQIAENFARAAGMGPYLAGLHWGRSARAFPRDFVICGRDLYPIPHPNELVGHSRSAERDRVVGVPVRRRRSVGGRSILHPTATRERQRSASRAKSLREHTPCRNETARTRRGKTSNHEPRRLFPRRANEANATPAQNERARCHGENPCAAGVPIAPKPPSQANATPRRAKRPPGRTNATAGRARQGNRAAEPKRTRRRTQRPAQNERGKGPRATDERPTDTNAAGPPAGARPIQQKPAQTGRTAKRFRPPRGGCESLLSFVSSPSGVDTVVQSNGRESCSAPAPA